jgi:hypothetical protein
MTRPLEVIDVAFQNNNSGAQRGVEAVRASEAASPPWTMKFAYQAGGRLKRPRIPPR